LTRREKKKEKIHFLKAKGLKRKRKERTRWKDVGKKKKYTKIVGKEFDNVQAGIHNGTLVGL
jgi:hypothetical protein